jgi:hypothetical protein
MIWIIFVLFLCLLPRLADAQTSAINTTNGSVKITTGLTYQQIFPANAQRNSLTFENNNTTSTENCWINVDGTVAAGNTTATSVTVNGVSMTAAQASILIGPNGGSYTRYFPHMPNGIIVGTCTTTGDSIYADQQ